MRLTLDARMQRLLRRLPHNSVYSTLEIVLLALLALQCARLIWAVATPVSPLGDWRRDTDGGVAIASTAIFSTFDPFFRLSQAGGPVVITGLNLKLFGVRDDQASGLGSAIIGLPDGTQASYGIGEEILPGVKLVAVAFENATIERGGTREQLFLDQSQTATSMIPMPASASLAGPKASQLMQETEFSPRRDGNDVTGFMLQPRGSGAAFLAAGFQPGDVLVSVNGVTAGAADPAGELTRQLQASGEARVEVERSGRPITIQVKLAR
jgi:general secretion pathway protein C